MSDNIVSLEGNLFHADGALMQNNDEHVLDVALSCRRATTFPLVLEDTNRKFKL